MSSVPHHHCKCVCGAAAPPWSLTSNAATRIQEVPSWKECNLEKCSEFAESYHEVTLTKGWNSVQIPELDIDFTYFAKRDLNGNGTMTCGSEDSLYASNMTLACGRQRIACITDSDTHPEGLGVMVYSTASTALENRTRTIRCGSDAIDCLYSESISVSSNGTNLSCGNSTIECTPGDLIECGEKNTSWVVKATSCMSGTSDCQGVSVATYIYNGSPEYQINRGRYDRGSAFCRPRYADCPGYKRQMEFLDKVGYVKANEKCPLSWYKEHPPVYYGPLSNDTTEMMVAIYAICGFLLILVTVVVFLFVAWRRAIAEQKAEEEEREKERIASRLQGLQIYREMEEETGEASHERVQAVAEQQLADINAIRQKSMKVKKGWGGFKK
uniref:Uncharacterized protein n=1 Tax=Chromera velia CCMP2878 TaxID=1169474 RepID=A0A0G4IAY5_9ALVE|eukprot:Cvel_2156.t1-p1 / transcript=Cvel_2156.t1 / gene=Cvel_2156 / organism=Chromera_velia_CCMP2878 / gene_product=hypothetical protein / transcript_product=hypothetical protein / location=Cvel_scaffold83:136102-138462(+) / protein_length=383 / sequence_SO=supercontig / SO=protein_coding / is_pseudo=false